MHCIDLECENITNSPDADVGRLLIQKQFGVVPSYLFQVLPVSQPDALVIFRFIVQRFLCSYSFVILYIPMEHNTLVALDSRCDQGQIF